MNIFNHKKIIFVLILIIIAFFAYWFLFVSKQDAQDNINQNTNQNNQNVIPINKVSNTQYDKEFVGSLLGLNSVELDTSVFESKVYKSLNYPQTPFVVNYSRETGRTNPFLPINIEAVTNTVEVNTQEKQVETKNPTDLNVSSTTINNSTTTKPNPKVKNF